MIDNPSPQDADPVVRRAVIMAGGRGTRLRPFTFAFPKPLVPIGDIPIIDVVVRQLRAAGVRKVTVAVGHLAELLMAYFSSSNYDGLTIEFSREDTPLGTAGPLTLIEDLDEPFFVLNGDLLTSLDYRDLAREHFKAKAEATIASYTKQYQIDLGILEVDEGNRLRAYHEKPSYSYRVSMGIYIFEPRVLGLLHRGERCDLPELVTRILGKERRLHVYPFEGYWLDIGRPEDYARAVEEFEKMKPILLKESF